MYKEHSTKIMQLETLSQSGGRNLPSHHSDPDILPHVSHGLCMSPKVVRSLGMQLSKIADEAQIHLPQITIKSRKDTLKL